MALAEMGQLEQAERDLAKAVSYGHRISRRRQNGRRPADPEAAAQVSGHSPCSKYGLSSSTMT